MLSFLFFLGNGWTQSFGICTESPDGNVRTFDWSRFALVLWFHIFCCWSFVSIFTNQIPVHLYYEIDTLTYKNSFSSTWLLQLLTTKWQYWYNNYLLVLIAIYQFYFIMLKSFITRKHPIWKVFLKNYFTAHYYYQPTSSLAHWVECLPMVWETWVQSQIVSY